MQLTAALREIPGAAVYRDDSRDFAPVVSFVLPGETPAETGARLASGGFCLRAGLHCAPLAHRTVGTMPDGTVRFSPSASNTAEEVAALIRMLAPAQ